MRSPRRADPSGTGAVARGEARTGAQPEIPLGVDDVFDSHDHVSAQDSAKPGVIDPDLARVLHGSELVFDQRRPDFARLSMLPPRRTKLIKLRTGEPFCLSEPNLLILAKVLRRLAVITRTKSWISHDTVPPSANCPIRAYSIAHPWFGRMYKSRDRLRELPRSLSSPPRRELSPSLAWTTSMTEISPPAVARVIDGYVADVPEAHWAAIGTFVRDTVTDLAPQTAGVARNYLAATAKFAHWLWQSVGADLDPQSVFRPALINRFMQEVMSAHSSTYQYQTTQRLNVLAAHFTRTVPARLNLKDPHAVSTYTERELASFCSSAARRNNPARRSNAHVLLALGAGAGLRAEEIAAARVGDIVADPQGISVAVHGKQPRLVPVHRRWVNTLTLSLAGRPAKEFAFSGYRPHGYPARVIHQLGIDDPDEQTPSATRLRATWIVLQLNAGLPLDLLLNIAGLNNPTSLAPYVRVMNRHDLVDYRDVITGHENAR